MELPIVGQGGEQIVYDLDQGRVLKMLSGDSPEARLLWFQTNAAEFPVLKEYLGKFLPETVYHEQLPACEVPPEFEGQPGVIQERISGRVLAVLDDAELNDPQLLQELIGLMEAVLKLKQETRELIIDWMGSKPEERKHNRLSPLCSSNVLVTDDGECRLIDTNTVNDRIVVDEKGLQRAQMFPTLLSIGWFLKNNSLQNYFKYVYCVARLKATRLAYKLYYATIFKLTLRSLKRKFNAG